MSIESTDIKLALFPFPSITICNQNKLSKSKFDQIMNNSRYSELVTREQMKLAMLTLLKMEEAHKQADNLSEISKIFKNNGITTKELINITMQVRTVSYENQIKYYILLNIDSCIHFSLIKRHSFFTLFILY